jgi:predicted CXXCH cytochrome family protein
MALLALVILGLSLGPSLGLLSHEGRSVAVYAAQDPTSAATPATPQPLPELSNPDLVCAGCHRKIYNSYENTHMAQGSGAAIAGLIPGSYRQNLAGIDYSVYERSAAAWMSYSRSPADPKGELSGERHLRYFIGSGAQGRTYLYQIDHQWFELPINFYAQRNGYEMAPAFAHATRMPAPLPTDPNCLHCHATGIQPAEATARNRYAGAPFVQGGIGCSACHGDPSAHLAQHGHGAIANPDKFAPQQRDSACIQCHLEGDAVVYRPGRSLAQFVPGDNLADIAVYFVKASQATGGGRAVSQYEALLQSACKRASGDKLTCTTCHDPHFSPSEAHRVQYFRDRCLSCHTGQKMARHHPEERDCATCHMPARPTTDISHAQIHDHNIEAQPGNPAPRVLDASGQYDLVPVGNFPASDRDFGLAYAQMAQRGMPHAAAKALSLLTRAAQTGGQNGGHADHELEAQLGYLLQVAGDPVKASAAYAAALQSDPYDPTALANLAVIDAATRHLPEAIHLLDRLTAADPSQTSAGLNLAFIDCSIGHPKEAIALLQRLAAVHPDDPQLLSFQHHGNYAGQHCELHPIAQAAAAGAGGEVAAR